MSRGPKVKDLVAIPASRFPSFEKPRTPRVVSRKLPGRKISSASEPVRLGGRRCLREYLDLEPARLREENESTDGRGAWNPS